MNGVAGRTYVRSAAVLDADDQRDLESYFEHLRAYYEIPADQPVFPARRPTAAERSTPARRAEPDRATALNRGDHPWRNTL